MASILDAQHLLPISLYDVLWTGLGLVRILTGGSPSATLTEQIPTLVKGGLNRLQPSELRLVQADSAVRTLKSVLFMDKFPDLAGDLDVVHQHTSVVAVVTRHVR